MSHEYSSNKTYKYQLIKDEEETSFLTSDLNKLDSTSNKNGIKLNKISQVGYDKVTDEDNDSKFYHNVFHAKKDKQLKVINPLYNIDEYNSNNNNNENTNKTGSFLNILTKTFKYFANKNEKQMKSSNFIDNQFDCVHFKNEINTKLKFETNNNGDFLIDDVKMSPRDDDKCVLKLYMPRKCLQTDELELKRESTQCKTYKNPTKRKKSKTRCHRSSSADLANRPNNFKMYSNAKNFRSSNLNQNNSLLKINKFSFNNNNNSSLSSSNSSCDLFEPDRDKRINKPSYKCLLFLIALSILFNPVFGKLFIFLLKGLFGFILVFKF